MDVDYKIIKVVENEDGTIDVLYEITRVEEVWKKYKPNTTPPIYNIRSYNDTILSDKEVEVLAYVIDGFTSKQIAKILNKGHRTVESQRDSIRKKLNVKDRWQLIEVGKKLLEQIKENKEHEKVVE